MIYTQSSQNQNDSFYQQPSNQDQYYGSNPDLIPIKNCKFLPKIINLIFEDKYFLQLIASNSKNIWKINVL